MRRINEDITIHDPGLQIKWNQANKQINVRQKKIAQLQSEIVVFKQQMQRVEELAMKKQQATIKSQEETKNDVQNQSQQKQQLDPKAVAQELTGLTGESMKIRTFEEFLKEEEGSEDDEDLSESDGYDYGVDRSITEPEDIVPSDHEIVQAYRRSVDVEGYLGAIDRDSDLAKRINRIEHEIDLYYAAIREIENEAKRDRREFNDHQEWVAGRNPEWADILSSGMSDEDKVKAIRGDSGRFERGGDPLKTMDVGAESRENMMPEAEAQEIVSDWNYFFREMERSEKTREEEIPNYRNKIDDRERQLEEISELQKYGEELYEVEVLVKGLEKEIEKWENRQIEEDTKEYQGIIEDLTERLIDSEDKLQELKAKYEEMKKGNKLVEDFKTFYSEILTEVEDEVEYEEDVEETGLEEDEELFYVRLNDDVAPAVVKVYKESDEEDERWVMSVVEGDNTALEEMQFEPEFEKLEIINYLADIYEDVEEIFQEDVDDIVDEKKELDEDFYE